MSDTPEDTELKKELKKDFNQLLVKEFTADWKTQRLIMELNIDVMSLDNLINLITLHTQKANIKLLEHLKTSNPMYTHEALKDILDELTGEL